MLLAHEQRVNERLIWERCASVSHVSLCQKSAEHRDASPKTFPRPLPTLSHLEAALIFHLGRNGIEWMEVRREYAPWMRWAVCHLVSHGAPYRTVTRTLEAEPVLPVEVVVQATTRPR